MPVSGSASSYSEAGGCAVWHRERNGSSMTGYMIGPDVTMQLVDDEAVILTSDPGSGAFPSAACYRSSARQYTAGRCPALRPESGRWDLWEERD